jgi:uncharacterized delta-60 repeat protein
MLRVTTLLTTGFATFAFAVAGAGAAPGDLDRSFGNRGFVRTSNGSEGRALALQQNERIVAVGNWVDGYAIRIVRYLRDGSLDPTFGNGGLATVLDVGAENGSIHPAAAGIDSVGRIVVAGKLEDPASLSGIVVFRVLPGGDLDTSFGDQGMVVLDPGVRDGAVGLEVRADDSVLVGGYANEFRQDSAFVVARIDDQGDLDAGYGDGGIAVVPVGRRSAVAAMAVDSAGRATLAGQWPNETHMIRLTSDGELDDSFSGDGHRTLDLGRREQVLTLAIGKRERILVGGEVAERRAGQTGHTNLVLARLKPGGSLDRRFSRRGRRGIVTTDVAKWDYASSLEPQADGKIVLAGIAERFGYNFSYGVRWVVLRYRKNGRLDRSFSGNGRSFPNGNGYGPKLGHGPAMEMQSNGRVLLLGWTQEDELADPSGFVLARLRNDGRPLGG